MFCGHPSLRFGDVIHFIELWGSNPNNTIVFTGRKNVFLRFLISITKDNISFLLSCIFFRLEIRPFQGSRTHIQSKVLELSIKLANGFSFVHDLPLSVCAALFLTSVTQKGDLSTFPFFVSILCFFFAYFSLSCFYWLFLC